MIAPCHFCTTELELESRQPNRIISFTMSTRPSKRQRSEDLSLLVAAETIRSTFWYDDGNIILQADFTQFRVHRSVLSKQSSVFEGMFLMPQHPNSEDSTVEGCPVVFMPDRADDLSIVISMFYDMSFVNCVFNYR